MNPRSGFRIGKLFGISIRIDVSWLLIFAFVTLNLAAALSELHPEWNTVLTWGLAVLAALLFFASVLLHELAHSLVAQAQGTPVHNITLFLFGGVSNIQREPASPGAEFLMALVGPLTSLLLGAVLTIGVGIGSSILQAGLTDPVQAVQRLGPFSTILLWLGSINIILGIFNMIPGFPLDGGRIVRSLLWAVTDDLQRATRWASWLGQAIGWTMIFGGVSMALGVRLPFFGSGLGNGLWLAFIGWFLNNAAAQSYQRMVVQDLLEGVPVSQMMRRDPPTVTPDLTIYQLMHEYVMQRDDHAFPVLEDTQLVGIITLDDVRKMARDDWTAHTVREVMLPAARLVTVTPDKDAAEALEQLAQLDVRQLPVLEHGQLVGLLRRRDIVKWLQWSAKMA